MQSWTTIINGLLKNKAKAGDAAPHRPLLALLIFARAAEKGKNEFPFSEIYTELGILLRRFGLGVKRLQPELPFWHLQSSKCWNISSADQIPLGLGGKRPTLGELKKRNPIARVPTILWRQLTKDSVTPHLLARRVLDGFWTVSLHEELAAHVGIDLHAHDRKSISQAKFHEDVMRAYEGSCAVCGCDTRLGDDPFGLDAAHIMWRAYGGKNTVSNGLALCPLHHKAFDRGAYSLTDDLDIVVSQDLRGTSSTARDLCDLSGKPIRRPQGEEYRPDLVCLDWHRSRIFRGPARKLA